MFQSKKARSTAVAVILFSVGYFPLLAACYQESPEANSQVPSRADLFADPLGVHVPASEAQRNDPRVVEERPTPGSVVNLMGKVVDSRSLRPEINCLISVDGQEVYSDSEGNFTLESVRTGSDLRVRFRCRGLIERHVIRVPTGESVVQLPEAIVIGRSLHGAQGAAANPSLRSTFSTAVDDLRRMPPAAAPAPSNVNPEESQRATADGALSDAIQTAPDTLPPSSAASAPSAQGTVPSPTSATSQTPSLEGPQPLEPPRGPGFMRSYESLSVKPDEKVDGTLSAGQIHPELRRRVLAFYSCYADFLESDPTHRIHHMRVRWTIEPNGTVSSSELLNSTERDPEKNQCLLRRVNRLVFPSSSGKTVVERTFIFGFRLDPMGQIP